MENFKKRDMRKDFYLPESEIKMSPITKENVIKAALLRRKFELEMLQMKSEMKGARLIDTIKPEWLAAVKLENSYLDELISDQKKRGKPPLRVKNGSSD